MFKTGIMLAAARQWGHLPGRFRPPSACSNPTCMIIGNEAHGFVRLG